MSQESTPQHEYPQVTTNQIELWLLSPVTQAYLQSLEWYLNDVRDVPLVDMVDSSNADITSSNIHVNMGQEQGLTTAHKYVELLNRYGLIEEEKDDAEDK